MGWRNLHADRMSSIYLHIPFCRQACHYCNFHFTTSLHYKTELIAALMQEIEMQKVFFSGGEVRTIYFGGGTPSLLDLGEIEHLLEKIRGLHSLSPDAEITIEANPDDITNDKLIAWRSMGINRLSIGVQSFFEEDLRWMNRAHDSMQSLKSLDLAQKHFSNITIDLIYGVPGLTDEKWQSNVGIAISRMIPHVSCYALTVEAKTPLDKMIRERKTTDVDPAVQSRQFLLLMQWMEEAGYEHYEISNFSKPGFRSRHNSAYWSGHRYLGIGPSAHSFDGSNRQWNISNNQQYIRRIMEGHVPFEKEILTVVQRTNEYIMTSLRTSEGISLGKLIPEERERLKKEALKFMERGLMVEEGGAYILTKEGKLFADGIAADLFR